MQQAAKSLYLDAFLDTLWLADNLSANTLAAYRRDLLRLAAALAPYGHTLDSADTPALEQVMLGLIDTDKPATRARRLSAARRYYHYLCQQKLRDDDPSARLQAPRLWASCIWAKAMCASSARATRSGWCHWAKWPNTGCVAIWRKAGH